MEILCIKSPGILFRYKKFIDHITMNKSTKYEMHVQIYIIQMYLLLKFLQWLAPSLFLHVIDATPQAPQLIISISC